MNPQQAIRPAEIGTNRIRDLLQGSYSKNTEARELAKKNKMKLDENLSNAEQKIYVDEKGNPTITYAGSRKISDWLVTNPLLALGLEKYSPRFKRSEKVMEDVRKKYGGKPVTIVGHSLGAAIGTAVGKKQDKIISVDRGIGLGGIGKKLGSNVTDIRTSNDLVSALRNTQSGGRLVTIKDKKNLNLLGAHDYRQLSKLNNKII
jgi:hypothetical protein